jgi:hypothetical protein
MAGLVPAIHVFDPEAMKTWIPAQASLRSLRKLGCERGHDDYHSAARRAATIWSAVLPVSSCM